MEARGGPFPRSNAADGADRADGPRQSEDQRGKRLVRLGHRMLRQTPAQMGPKEARQVTSDGTDALVLMRLEPALAQHKPLPVGEQTRNCPTSLDECRFRPSDSLFRQAEVQKCGKDGAS